MRPLLLVLAWWLCSAAAWAEAPRVDRVATLVARGQQRSDAGDLLSAIGYFRDAVSQAPRDPRGYKALAGAYLATDQAERAVEVYEAALYACGEVPELLLALAEAHERCQRPEVALLILRSLAERPQPSERVHELRAQIAETTGRFAEALDARRARLAQLASSPGQASVREAELQVRALSLLVGEADALSSEICNDDSATPVRRALVDCR